MNAPWQESLQKQECFLKCLQRQKIGADGGRTPALSPCIPAGIIPVACPRAAPVEIMLRRAGDRFLTSC